MISWSLPRIVARRNLGWLIRIVHRLFRSCLIRSIWMDFNLTISRGLRRLFRNHSFRQRNKRLIEISLQLLRNSTILINCRIVGVLREIGSCICQLHIINLGLSNTSNKII